VNEDVGIPLMPMILALAFGACLGGIGHSILFLQIKYEQMHLLIPYLLKF
jgi:hypothetical protein